MAISKPVFLVFFMICSWGSVAYSQGVPGGDSLPCIQKLLPCQPFLKGPLSSLPASCCVPLKQIVAEDSECLCKVFNNQDILKTFNVTQDDALDLAKACGANADTSICHKAAAPSGSHSTPATPSASTHSSAPSPPPKNEATAIHLHHVGGFVAVATILSFFISAF